MSAAVSYRDFLEKKSQAGAMDGFTPRELPSFLFDFQASLVEWALRKARAGIFADCGLGKGPMELVWADQVMRQTNRPAILVAPLAVSHQVVREAEKFGIPARRSSDGRVYRDAVTVTNYERLSLFDPSDVAGAVCDESSILKSFDGVRRAEITHFLKKLRYRLLGTATAAPNDYVELGTSSEALGELGYIDVLNRFFKNDLNNSATGRGYLGSKNAWRFKGYAEEPFWRWVSSWARALRRPSDLGFADERFILPPLEEVEHVVESATLPDGMLFALPAADLHEQREERRRTLRERCERVASLTVDTGQPALVWCHLNEEGDLLERLIPGSVQVAGSDPDDEKEEKLLAFAAGEARVLVTKPKIGAWGLNFQHCAHVTVFPSHSFEQYYQCVRRCWRFGQTRAVRVDVVTTEGERGVKENLQRKAAAADRMFDALVSHMHAATTIDRQRSFVVRAEVPSWAVAIRLDEARSLASVRAQRLEDRFALYNGDCVDVMASLRAASVHLSLYSPPFGGLYHYSSDDRDLSNCRDYREFFEHYAFVVREIARLTIPGRMTAVHCMDVPSGNTGTDYLVDFPGDIIRLHEREGFHYIARYAIWKEPLAVRNRTMAKNLAHKTIVEDSSRCSVASADYLLVFRRDGKNPIPIAHPLGLLEYAGSRKHPADTLRYRGWAGNQIENKYSHWIWRQYASAFWDDIRLDRVLPYREAREADDEKHVHPLQLDVIDRVLTLWSNPDEVILSPFAGVGSEIFGALRAGRRAIGIELKASYYRQMDRNVDAALLPGTQQLELLTDSDEVAP